MRIDGLGKNHQAKVIALHDVHQAINTAKIAVFLILDATGHTR